MKPASFLYCNLIPCLMTLKTIRIVSFLFIATTMLSGCSKKEQPREPEIAIFNFAPKSGKQGNEVVLWGNFIDEKHQHKVYFNGIEAQVLRAHPDSLVVMVPNNSDATGYITVTNLDKIVQSNEIFTYLVPEITGIDPVYAGAGDTLRIKGKYFCPDPSVNEVTLNGIKVRVVASSENEMAVIVPKNRNSTGKVKIKTCNFSVEGIENFTYLLSPVQVITLAGQYAGYRDGQGTDALFLEPNALEVDEAGNIYVADLWNQRIRKITPDGMVSTVAGNGIIGLLDGPGATAQFHLPFGLTLDGKGNILVADYENSVVRKIDPTGNVSTLPKNIHGQPVDIAVDGDKTYVTDQHNNKIYFIDAGNNFSVFAGSGYADRQNGVGAEASFNQPTGIAFDLQHRLMVVDSRNNLIRVIDSTGKVETLITDEPIVHGFSQPMGIAVDYMGLIYVTDVRNHVIRRIRPDGKITTLAGDNTEGYLDGPPSKAKFNSPYGVATDKIGNVYVADRRNHRIRKIIME